MSNNDNRSQLAQTMITQLPRWGSWAASMREVDTPYGRIGYRQASIMWILRKDHKAGKDSMTTAIASEIGVQNSVITRAGEHLEELGLLKRTTATEDRRRQYLTLTENGFKASEYIEELYVTSITNELNKLDQGDIDNLAEGVEMLNELIAKIAAKPLGS